MANRTVKDARTVKGTNPQYLVEKIIRTRIYESKYWKEECFALSGVYIVYVNSVFSSANWQRGFTDICSQDKCSLDKRYD